MSNPMSFQQWLIEEHRRFFQNIATHVNFASADVTRNNMSIFPTTNRNFMPPSFPPPPLPSSSMPTTTQSVYATASGEVLAPQTFGQQQAYYWPNLDHHLSARSALDLQNDERRYLCKICMEEYPCSRSVQIQRNIQLGRQYKCPYKNCTFICFHDSFLHEHLLVCPFEHMNQRSKRSKMCKMPSASTSSSTSATLPASSSLPQNPRMSTSALGHDPFPELMEMLVSGTQEEHIQVEEEEEEQNGRHRQRLDK